MSKDKQFAALVHSICPFCMRKHDERILIHQRLQDISTIHGQSVDEVACDKCQGYTHQGVIFVEVDESKTTDMKNPWRTGKLWVLTDNAVNNVIQPPELLQQVLKKRVCFIPVEAAQQLGLHDFPSTTKENCNA